MAQVTEIIKFKHCQVEIYDEDQYLETVFLDGTKVPATPNFDQESKARAAALGFTGDDATWQMSRQHEILHTILAEAMGYPWSPVLWSVAHQVRFPEGTAKQEESLVLCVQKLINDAKIGRNSNE